MSDTEITERQQYWLDHVRAAEAVRGSDVGAENSVIATLMRSG